MDTPGKTNWKTPIAIVGLMTVTALGVTQVPGLRPSDFLLRHWQRGLEVMPEQDMARRLRQIGQLGPPGVRTMVESLGHRRAALAEAAGRALHGELDRWEAMPVSRSSPLIATLMLELARRVDEFGPTARSTASELATRALRWPVDGEEIDQQQLIAHCEQIVRAVKIRPRAPEQPFAVAPLLRNGDPVGGATRLLAEEGLGEEGVRGFRQGLGWQTDPLAVKSFAQDAQLGDFFGSGTVELPGGDLPTEPVEMPSLPPSLATRPFPRAVPSGRAPRLIPPPRQEMPRVIFSDSQADSESSSIGQEPVILPDVGRAATRATTRHQKTIPEPSGPDLGTDRWDPSLRPPPSATPPARSEDARNVIQIDGLVPQRLNELPGKRVETSPDMQVMRRLDDSRPQIVETATSQLKQRGFSSLELDMARKIISPDPVTRRRLAESLPTLSVKPYRWLMWLSEDTDPEVRRIAVVLMATTRDPRLHRRLDTMQLQERDPRVQEQLRRGVDQLRRWAKAG